jgi:energy-coupling factor transport system substrate-specific component
LDKKLLNVRQITLFGVLAAMTFGAKVAMSYLPNIEPVTLFLLVFGAVFGWRGIFIAYTYVAAEILFYGLGLWNINYLYIWLVPVLAGWGLRRMKNPLLWAAVSGVFGLLFGALCAPVDLCIGGVGYAVSKWISGIPFDLAHGFGNFVLTGLLLTPLRRLTQRLYQGIIR